MNTRVTSAGTASVCMPPVNLNTWVTPAANGNNSAKTNDNATIESLQARSARREPEGRRLREVAAEKMSTCPCAIIAGGPRIVC